jgi:hypothetical protein
MTDASGVPLEHGPADDARASSAGEQPGDVIDRYTLVEEIGAGGMGTVWLARQEQPVQRQVALKVIKLGMDTRQVVARFEAERQALALMIPAPPTNPAPRKRLQASPFGGRSGSGGFGSFAGSGLEGSRALRDFFSAVASGLSMRAMMSATASRARGQVSASKERSLSAPPDRVITVTAKRSPCREMAISARRSSRASS